MLVFPGYERNLGAAAFRTALASARRSNDQAAQQLILSVGRRIADAAKHAEYQWEFVLLDSPIVNAFCCPGGKVVVYSGLLGVTKNEAQLAIVLGHEVAHATARHGAERMSDAMLISAIGRSVSAAAGQYAPDFQNLAEKLYGVGTYLGIALPYSRAHEREADYIGLLYAARAGYDPHEAIPLWESMKLAGRRSGEIPEFLSTHPSEDRRIQRLGENMPKAEGEYAAAIEKHGVGVPIGSSDERTPVQADAPQSATAP